MNPRRLRSSAVRLVKYWRRTTTRQCSAKVVCCNRSTRMQPLDAIATETLLPAIEQRARDARFLARGAHADRDRAPNDFRRGSSLLLPTGVPLPGYSLWER